MAEASESGPDQAQPAGRLKRELGVFGAMMMGLGSIVGTGVFVSIGISASIAGPAVLLAVCLAAFVAMCNALSSAQLAAAHPVSGGTYEYGYRLLRPEAGFTAGWMFLCAKSASAASAALGFSGYLLTLVGTGGHWPLVAVAAGIVVALTVLVLTGIRRTSWVNIAVVSVTLASLTFFVLAGIRSSLRDGAANLRPFFQNPQNAAGGAGRALLYATALMFVAYTGYGRIATLGEEVRRPRRTIPRAIILTLIVSMALYVSVALVAVAAAGTEELTRATQQRAAPLEVIASRYAVPGAGAVLAVGAMTAMVGVLLNLLLGLSRVVLAMGRRGDMPRRLARLSAAGTTPYLAVVLVALVITSLVMIGNIHTTWSFSAFTVLIYYALTNLSALRLPPERRLFPRWLAASGLAACLFLAFWVQWQVWLVGLGLIVIGLCWHAAARRWRRPCVPPADET